MATTPIIAPDGSVADVPNEHVDALIAKGGKIGVDMLSPDGKERATVPQEHAQDLLKKGASFAPPAGTPGMPKPPNAIEQDVAKQKAAIRSDKPGAAEEAIGEGSSLMDSARAVTSGATFAAPVMTAGASLPVQSAIQGGAAALDTAAQGGSTKQIAVQGALNAAIPAVAAGVGSAVKAVKNYLDVPGAISKDVIGSFNQVAQKEGLPAVQSATARDAADELSQNFMNRAKSQYKVVDNAVGGDLKPVQEKIQDLKTAIRINKNVNPELAAKQAQQLTDQQKTLQDLIEKAKQNGAPNADQLMKQADMDYAKSKAVDKVAAGVKTASGQAKMGGHPHPGGFASQVDRLERTGILKRALGDEGSQSLIQNAQEGLSQAKKVANVKKGAGYVAAGAATAAGAGAGYKLYETLKGK